MDILSLRYSHTEGIVSPRQYISTPENPTSGVRVGMMKENAVAKASPSSQSVGLNLPLRQNMNRANMLHSRWKTLPWTKWNVRWCHWGHPNSTPHSARKPPMAISTQAIANTILSFVCKVK